MVKNPLLSKLYVMWLMNYSEVGLGFVYNVYITHAFSIHTLAYTGDCVHNMGNKYNFVYFPHTLHTHTLHTHAYAYCHKWLPYNSTSRTKKLNLKAGVGIDLCNKK